MLYEFYCVLDCQLWCRQRVRFSRKIGKYIYKDLPAYFFLFYTIYVFRSSIKTTTLQRWEPDNYELLKKNCEDGKIPTYLYFNKGL